MNELWECSTCGLTTVCPHCKLDNNEEEDIVLIDYSTNNPSR